MKKEKGAAAAADTTAAGAIEGAGAALDAGGTARDVAAAAIGGAAAGAAEAERDAGGDLAEASDDQAQTDDVSPVVARVETIAEEWEFDDPFFAKGDLRDLILRLFRERPKAWSQMNEAEQRDLIAAVENGSTTVIQKIARGIASEGRQEVTTTLEAMTVKDGLKLTLKGPYSHEAMLMLGDAQGKQVIVTMPRSDRFDNARSAAEYDPDAPGLFPAGSSDLAEAGDRMRVIRGEDGRLEAIVWGNRRVERDGESDGEGKLVVVNVDTGADLGEPTPDERAQFDFAADNPQIASSAAGPEGTLTVTVDLKTSMVVTRDAKGDVTDERAATPDELAAERERLADFDDGLGGGLANQGDNDGDGEGPGTAAETA